MVIRRDNSGFTMVELVVVMAIIAVLAGISISFYSKYIDQAKLTLSIGSLNSLRTALDVYAIEHQNYPATINFANFTDQDGKQVADPSLVAQLKENVFSFDNYSSAPSSYRLTAKGADSAHTVITLTPQNVSH